MKTLSKINLWIGLVGLCGTLTASAGTAGTATNAPAKFVPIRSVFVMPTGPKEGRDPFFPESSRVYEANATTPIATVPVTEITTLKVKGYSVVNGQPMVIINNHAFMIGDEGDVLTSSGRVHIHCLAIKGGTVVVEAGNQRLDLRF